MLLESDEGLSRRFADLLVVQGLANIVILATRVQRSNQGLCTGYDFQPQLCFWDWQD